MKKTALLLVIVIIFSLFVTACGAPEEEIFDVEFEKSTEGIDLEGITLVYEFGMDPNVLDVPTCLGYELDTQFGDLASARLKKTQNDLNCKLDIRYTNNFNSCRQFVAASASGVFMCDMISGISDMWADVARIGMLVGLSELEDYIDFRNEDKWGHTSMLEVIYYEDDLYGITPMLWPEISVTFDSLMVVNENMIATLGETDPRDLLENGQWNWDTFDECLGRYYIEEGGVVKQYALTAGTGTFGVMFLLSNGSHYIEYDNSGNMECGFYTNEAIKAMQRGIDIFYGPNSHTIDSTSNVVDALIGDRTVLGSLGSGDIIGINGKIAKKMDNFGIVSWPCGPDVEPGYIVGHHANINNCISFSKMSNNPEACAAVISALYEPFEEYPTIDSLIDLMSKNYFYDRRDSEVFYKMCFNSVYNYFHYSPMYDFMHAWLSPNKSVSEYLEQNKGVIDERMNEYARATMNGIKAVWGDEND
jgi:hypothetical protein